MKVIIKSLLAPRAVHEMNIKKSNHKTENKEKAEVSL